MASEAGELATKLVLAIVKARADAPAVADLGDSKAIVGAGPFNAKVPGFEAPPPGDGLVTTTR